MADLLTPTRARTLLARTAAFGASTAVDCYIDTGVVNSADFPSTITAAVHRAILAHLPDGHTLDMRTQQKIRSLVALHYWSQWAHDTTRHEPPGYVLPGWERRHQFELEPVELADPPMPLTDLPYHCPCCLADPEQLKQDYWIAADATVSWDADSGFAFTGDSDVAWDVQRHAAWRCTVCDLELDHEQDTPLLQALEQIGPIKPEVW